MIKNDRVYGKPLVLYTNTKANIQAMTELAEGSFAYATDSDQIGTYSGSSWEWIPIRAWGSMYQDDAGTTITVSATNTDYIVTGMSQGVLGNVTFLNSRELKIQIAGIYLATWSISFTTASANQEIEGAIGVGGVRVASTSAHSKIGTGTDTVQMGATGLLNLAADDLIQLTVRNETAAVNIAIQHCNVALVYQGPPIAAPSNMFLLESGDRLLLESGDKLLLE